MVEATIRCSIIKACERHAHVVTKEAARTKVTPEAREEDGEGGAAHCNGDNGETGGCCRWRWLTGAA